ncbi:MAG: hypothetical protein QF570_22785 [Myxococcota bacterium]|jgi:hypothetical protein|nr:hypothetical protein [Myxococcota bacterium]
MSTRLDLSTLSLMDALDLATLIEMEAYQRYKMFVRQLGHRGTNDPAAVFASMAEKPADTAGKACKSSEKRKNERPATRAHFKRCLGAPSGSVQRSAQPPRKPLHRVNPR